jgi:hypothetical protein
VRILPEFELRLQIVRTQCAGVAAARLSLA